MNMVLKMGSTKLKKLRYKITKLKDYHDELLRTMKENYWILLINYMAGVRFHLLIFWNDVTTFFHI